MEALADALLKNPGVFYGRWYLVVSLETRTLVRIMEDRKEKKDMELQSEMKLEGQRRAGRGVKT